MVAMETIVVIAVLNRFSVVAHHSATIHSSCNVHSQDGGQTVCGIRGLYAGSCVRATYAGPQSSTLSTDKAVTVLSYQGR